DYRPATAEAPPAPPEPAAGTAPAAVPPSPAPEPAVTPAPPAAAPAAAPPTKPATAQPVEPTRPEEGGPEQPQQRRLRGAAALIARNMDQSLSIPTATSVRAIPAKLLVDNRVVINNHLRSEERRVGKDCSSAVGSRHAHRNARRECVMSRGWQ